MEYNKKASPTPYLGGAGEANYMVRKNITGGEICFAYTIFYKLPQSGSLANAVNCRTC